LENDYQQKAPVDGAISSQISISANTLRSESL
jgi:hypothetical protein